MRALSFGEILWDIIEDQEHIGGAPFNLAAHLAQMGAESALVSSVGEDDRGLRALRSVEQFRVMSDYIRSNPELPTGTVLVSLDAQGKPSYDIRSGSAWDSIKLDQKHLSSISAESWDVVAFGTLAQRSKENRVTLQQLVEAAAAREVFFDVNLRLDYYSKQLLHDSMGMASILKLNDEELDTVSELLFDKVMPEQDFCTRLEERWGVHTVVLTRGKLGSSVFSKGRLVHIPVVDVRVEDTVGAGDSYSAAFLYAYFITEDVEKAANLAALVSSYVASRNGAVPAYDEPVRKAIARITREAMEPEE